MQSGQKECLTGHLPKLQCKYKSGSGLKLEAEFKSKHHFKLVIPQSTCLILS